MTAETNPQFQEFQPATMTELSRFVTDNFKNEQKKLIPVGGRTALNYGYQPDGPATNVSTIDLTQVIDYPARDMTITVEAGIRVEQLAELLRVEGQQLAIDVPQANRATVGGIIATNCSGSRRFGLGTLRDYLIGMTAIRADGTTFHSGGRVVKNVAGYDLNKLMIGSLGTLAILTQVTLRVKPIPETRGFAWICCQTITDIEAVLERLNTSATRPVILDVLNTRAARQVATESKLSLDVESPVLIVGFEGNEAEVNWQVETLNEEIRTLPVQETHVIDNSQSAQVLNGLTEFQISSDDPLTFKATVRPSLVSQFLELTNDANVSLQSHAGNGIVIGHIPDSAINVSRAQAVLEPIQSFVKQHKGHLEVFQCDPEWKSQVPVFVSSSQNWPLMQKVKQTLDPQEILNPGRLQIQTV